MRENEVNKHLLYEMSLSNPAVTGLVIADCRPTANAIANMVKGGGYERLDEKVDEMFQLQFLHIDNIHVMRDSLLKVLQAVDSLRVAAIELARAENPDAAGPQASNRPHSSIAAKDMREEQLKDPADSGSESDTEQTVAAEKRKFPALPPIPVNQAQQTSEG